MQRPEAAQKMLVQVDDFPVPTKATTPASGTVAVPSYDFAEQFSEFSFYTCLTKPEVIVASTKVRPSHRSLVNSGNRSHGGLDRGAGCVGG